MALGKVYVRVARTEMLYWMRKSRVSEAFVKVMSCKDKSSKNSS